MTGADCDWLPIWDQGIDPTMKLTTTPVNGTSLQAATSKSHNTFQKTKSCRFGTGGKALRFEFGPANCPSSAIGSAKAADIPAPVA
jgi:hypothetical protein